MSNDSDIPNEVLDVAKILAAITGQPESEFTPGSEIPSLDDCTIEPVTGSSQRLSERIAENSPYTPEEIEALAGECDVQDLRDARIELAEENNDE